jgi:RNA polymerase sigma factor (sigma-70 family)
VTGGKGVARTVRLIDDELGPLVRSAQEGRPGAADALLAKLRPWFVGFFANRVDGDAAEDLAQAALIRVWRALSRIDANRPAVYLVTIAMNLLRTALQGRKRKDRRHVPLELAPPMVAPVTPDRETEGRDLTRFAHHLSLTTLSPELHEVVVGLLRGLRQSEIATDQNINPVTVRTRVRRARKRLAPRLRKHLVREVTLAAWAYRGDAPAPPPGSWRRDMLKSGEGDTNIAPHVPTRRKPSSPGSRTPAIAGPGSLGAP